MEGYLSEIRFFAPGWAPQGWESCKGQLLSVANNEALYSLIGVTYGGDGINTFALPNLAGRVAVGIGQGNGLSYRVSGEQSGVDECTLNIVTIPGHTHSADFSNGAMNIPVNTASGDEDGADPSAGVLGNGGSDKYASSNTAGSSYAGGAVPMLGQSMTTVTGGNSAHANDQPYLVLNPIICVQGIYPSRP